MPRTPLALMALAFLSGSACMAQAVPGVVAEYDLVYTRAGGTDLKIDMAWPAEGKWPYPAVLVIHGGAWKAGDKASNRPLLAEFAARGYVAVSPQYRFCPKEIFPAQVHDVKAAVRWLRANAGKYKVDPEHIGAVGFSAGGHLSLMLGLTGPSDGLEGDVPADAPSSKVQAVVNYFGPTDLAASDLPEVSKPLVRDFLGGTPEEKASAFAQASPLTFVTKDDAPVLTYQGTKDPLVPHSQATKLADAMTVAGVPGRVELLLGAGHGWSGLDLEQTKAGTFAFFDRYLRPKK
ncbi:MAG: alpha/beta hydrolase [Isosphaeraceae bacterium]